MNPSGVLSRHARSDLERTPFHVKGVFTIAPGPSPQRPRLQTSNCNQNPNNSRQKQIFCFLSFIEPSSLSHYSPASSFSFLSVNYSRLLRFYTLVVLPSLAMMLLLLWLWLWLALRWLNFERTKRWPSHSRASRRRRPI